MKGVLGETREEPSGGGAGAWKWVSHLTSSADLLWDAKAAWHSSGTVFPLGMWALDRTVSWARSSSAVNT